MTSETLSLKTIIKISIFLRKQLLFNEKLETKNLLLPSNIIIEQVPDPHNAKEHYESFLRKKN